MVRRQEIVNYETPIPRGGANFWGKKGKIDVFLHGSDKISI